VHHPLITRSQSAFKRSVREVGAQPYADAADRGLLRYLQVVVERGSSTSEVVVVATARHAPLEPLLARFSAQLGERRKACSSACIVVRSNANPRARCDKVRGSDAVCERIAARMCFSRRTHSGKPSRAPTSRSSSKSAQWVPDGVDVLELYAGTGAHRASRSCQGPPASTSTDAPGSLPDWSWAWGASRAVRQRARVHPGSAAAHASLAPGAQVRDRRSPARGLDAGVLFALCARPSGALHLLSCGLESFLADARALSARGIACRLTRLVAYTCSLHETREVLACFDRAD